MKAALLILAALVAATTPALAERCMLLGCAFEVEEQEAGWRVTISKDSEPTWIRFHKGYRPGSLDPVTICHQWVARRGPSAARGRRK